MQVKSLEDQLAKREHKIKELESQLSLTLSQVINNNREKVPITFDDRSGSDPSPTHFETVSTNISAYNSRRPSVELYYSFISLLLLPTPSPGQ